MSLTFTLWKLRDPVPRTPRLNYTRVIRAKVAARNKKYLEYLKYHRTSSSEYLEVFPEGQRPDFYIKKLHFFLFRMIPFLINFNFFVFSLFFSHFKNIITFVVLFISNFFFHKTFKMYFLKLKLISSPYRASKITTKKITDCKHKKYI